MRPRRTTGEAKRALPWDTIVAMEERELLKRVILDPKIFGGKPIIRGRRLAVEHVLGMLAAGDSPETMLKGYPWLEMEDIQACLVYARRLVGHERVEPLLMPTRTEGEAPPGQLRLGRCRQEPQSTI